MSIQKHSNVAIFVPHNGCPNQCSFCNQKSITGKSNQPSADDVISTLEMAKLNLKDHNKNAEIAFFGGSFTAIDKKYMMKLLDAAYPYVKDNTFSGIRLSTRPDAISHEILDILKSRGVTAIELGAQSMDNSVLTANFRGHTAEDVVKASMLIKDKNFSLGLQMMTGLYKSTPEKDYCTAQSLVSLKPDTVRIYPTVVMKNTELSKLYLSGKYNPPGVSESVSLCARFLVLFEENNIPVIRLGLHDTPELKNDMLAGAFHPAFRELCESEIYLKRALFSIKEQNIPQGEIYIYVNPKDLSKMIGQKKANIVKFKNLGFKVIIKGDLNTSIGNMTIKTSR